MNKVSATGNDKADICMYGVQLKEIKNFKYL